MDISIDTSELRTLAADMTAAPADVARKIPAGIHRSAAAIKDELRSEMSSSFWFRGVAPSISYDIVDGGMSAEIGPTKPGPGSLANIAYFGGANGGGGTVADPQEALDREAPNVEKFLGDLLEGLL